MNKEDSKDLERKTNVDGFRFENQEDEYDTFSFDDTERVESYISDLVSEVTE